LSPSDATKRSVPPVFIAKPVRVLREPIKRFPRRQFPQEAAEYNRRMSVEQMPLIRRGFQPAASKRPFESPHHASGEIQGLALSLGAHLVGFSPLREEWVYADRDFPGPYAVSLAMEMNAEEIRKAPGPEALIETLRVYHDLGWVIVKLAQELARMGYRAVPQHPFSRTHILQIPVAVDGGLGFLGRNGLLITETFGPRVRLGAVVTNLELHADAPRVPASAKFCMTCRACRDACPGGAIPDRPQPVNGVLKFKIDVDKCTPHFGSLLGCSVCIKACALNPGATNSGA